MKKSHSFDFREEERCMSQRWILGFVVAAFVLVGLMVPSASFADEKLVKAAKKEGEVVLYHSMSRRVLKKLVEEFQKKYGINVKWTRKGTGGIIRMVGAEKLAGALKCDIVSTGDPTSFMRWEKEGVLMKYVTPNTPKFVAGSGVQKEGWYTPSRTTYVSMGYSTKRVSASEAPKDWTDVLDPKWKGRIAIIDPRKSGPARWWLGSIIKKYGWDYVEKLAKNKPLLLKSASTSAVALLSGEADVLVIANEHDLVRRAAKGEPVKAIYPKGGLVYKTSPVGICAKAPHPNAARLWVNWESSAEAQAMVSQFGGYPPTRTDVKPFHKRDPKATNPANMLGLDLDWFLKNKKNLMTKFGKIMSGKGKM
jgi:iron(III) transport system substrate-binding protein